MTRLNSQVIMGGGCALILQENLATEPSVTTMDVGWIAKEEIPVEKQKINVRLFKYMVCSRAKTISSVIFLHLGLEWRVPIIT